MKNILIVDDNSENIYLLQSLLSGHGYEVTAAVNGVEALEKARSERPEMIIADILMPVMDGFELCRAWKRDDRLKDVPFVFYTATYTDPKDEEFALELGAARFIVKPQEPEVFLGILEEVFAEHQAGRPAAPCKPQIEEKVYIKEYNETLIRKLEAKMVQIEESNRRLEREVAERKQAERALRASESKFQSIVDNIGIGVSLISPDMEILELNRQMREWFAGIDLSQRPLCYRTFNDPPREEVCDYCPTIKTLQDGKVHEATTQTPQAKGMRNYRISSSPIRNAEGKVTAAIEMVEDITERRHLEEQLNQAMKMEAIGRLAGGVAHDFNNALTPILAISDILLTNLDPENPMYEDMREINRGAERCVSLTRQLLAFGRRQPLELTVLNLNPVVITVEKMLSRIIGENIELAKFLDPNLKNVKADIGQMEQILVNLAVNSRDAMPNGGKLTIETQNVEFDAESAGRHIAVTPGHYVMLAVSDTGTGIDEETRARIFEPFFTTKEKGQGTGLGLSIVYGIIKQCGGDIWVYSEPGKGTSFKTYLPSVEEEADTLSSREPAPATSYRGSETILLVEDEDSARKAIKRILEEHGYEILEAGNGEHALQLSEECKKPIHLILTDVVMPGMSGKEMAEKLLASRPDVKVLYVSGYVDDAIIHHGVLEKGTNFLQKPFTGEALAAKVRHVLDKDT